jgi:hypothetical protein
MRAPEREGVDEAGGERGGRGVRDVRAQKGPLRALRADSDEKATRTAAPRPPPDLAHAPRRLLVERRTRVGVQRMGHAPVEVRPASSGRRVRVRVCVRGGAGRERAGALALAVSVSRARPRPHCFCLLYMLCCPRREQG